MSRRRVVITGLGAVTPLGLNVPAFWEGLVAGRSGIAPITLFDAGAYPARIAGEVKGFAAGDFFDVREAKRLDRFAQFALVSGMEAVKDSGLDLDAEDMRRIGVLVGSGIGGLQEIEDQHSRLIERGPGKVSPFMVPKLMMNAGSRPDSHLLRLQRPQLRHRLRLRRGDQLGRRGRSHRSATGTLTSC